MVVEKSRVLTVPRAMVDVAPADVLEAAASHGVEGIVVKRLDSPYRQENAARSGSRSQCAPRPS